MDTARRFLADAQSPYFVWAIMQEIQQHTFDQVREDLLGMAAAGDKGESVGRTAESKLDEAIKALDKRYEKARKAEAATVKHEASWDASPLAC